MEKLVIFDLDGTILDTLSDLRNSVNYALTKKGLKEKTLDEIRNYVGNGIEMLMRRALPIDISEDDFLESFNIFKIHYEKNMQNETKPYPDILEVMCKIKDKGYKIAVVSNKFQYGVDELTKKFFSGLVDLAVGTSATIKPKPDPSAVNYVFETFSIKDPKKVYFVGDSEVDIITARNSNTKIISVTWGFRSKEQLESLKPDYIIDRPMDLLEIL